MNGCNENAIEFMTNGTKATLTFSQGRYKSVIRKLAEKHPDDCQIVADNEDGSICAHVPVAWIRISPPKQYTEEHVFLFIDIFITLILTSNSLSYILNVTFV